jgi:hypothetical protein
LQIGKEEVKLSLLANDMIVKLKVPIDSTKKFLDLIKHFGQSSEIKKNKYQYLFYLQAGKEISKSVLFIIA